MKEGVSEDFYRTVRDDAFMIMNAISLEITEALKNDLFLRVNENLQTIGSKRTEELDVTI